MSCYQPLDAWEVVDVKTGEISIVFKVGLPGFVLRRDLKLPCGQCMGCRLRRSQEWASRCMHEASLYDDNCFITLTYDNDHLPVDGSVHVKHFQDFMKRLRKKFSDSHFRFFHCGEYGELLSRPHYHACLFNFDFPDKVLWRNNNGVRLYRSSILESLWTFGFSSIGEVTFDSAAYVARYITKKINGDMAKDYYSGKHPEYITMSKGIGRGWYQKFKSDVYPSDEVIMNKHPIRPPRFYDKLYDIDDPFALEKVKADRVLRAKKFESEQTLPRRQARAYCLKDKLKKNKSRSFENGTV